MTAVFAFIDMSTATGIRGGHWMLTEDGVRDLREAGLSGEAPAGFCPIATWRFC